MRPGHRWRPAALLLAAALLLSGCGLTTVADAPLPGGAPLGDTPYQVTVLLTDAVDLVPNAGVRVNDVPVGVVRRVGLAPDGWTAQVDVAVNGAVALPANAVARLRQTSLLGEKFVELAPPADRAAAGRLAGGAVIGVNRTDVGAQVEEVLGAMSAVLGGGGVEKVATISREVNAATSGNEAQIRALLGNLTTFVGTLDAQRADIVRAIDSLDRLTRTLADQRVRMAGTLTDVGPGLAALEQQRGLLAGTLGSLQRLGGVAGDVVARSRAATVADLRSLQPILGNLVAAGNALPGSFQLLATMPFADGSLDVVKGDQINVDVSVALNVQTLVTSVLAAPSTPAADAAFRVLGTPDGAPGIAIPGLTAAPR